VADGEEVVLIGRSGCGKTTLLHVIAGITRADSGTIRVDNIELSELSEHRVDLVRAAKIGYVFQTFNLLPGFTALENVTLGMTFARGKKDMQRARHLLDRVGLSHRITHKPAALSVGEQQRVAVARALANKPSCPPGRRADGQHRPQPAEIIDLIRETCREEKVSLVLVTHSLEVAGQFDRVDKLEEINRVTAELAAAGHGS
jgi:putative ABC transport system ATP-binding protein